MRPGEVALEQSVEAQAREQVVDQGKAPDLLAVELEGSSVRNGGASLILGYHTQRLGARNPVTVRKSAEERLQDYAQAYRRLAAQLAETGYLWPGSISEQRLTCGKPTCACHQDPVRRHGPYLYWSTKVKGRTVNRLLTPEEVALYTEWIDNRRKLGQVQRQMLKLSQKVAPLLLRQRRARAPRR